MLLQILVLQSSYAAQFDVDLVIGLTNIIVPCAFHPVNYVAVSYEAYKKHVLYHSTTYLCMHNNITGAINLGTTLSSGSVNGQACKAKGELRITGHAHVEQDLHIEGDLLHKGIDVIEDLNEKLAQLQKQLAEVSQRVEECYFAPGGPGAAFHQKHFELLKSQQDNNRCYPS